jgi:hypothetical protein
VNKEEKSVEVTRLFFKHSRQLDTGKFYMDYDCFLMAISELELRPDFLRRLIKAGTEQYNCCVGKQVSYLLKEDLDYLGNTVRTPRQGYCNSYDVDKGIVIDGKTLDVSLLSLIYVTPEVDILQQLKLKGNIK